METYSGFDFRFVEIFYELYALEDYFVLLESQLPEIFTKETEKALKMLKQNKPANNEVELHQIYQNLADLEEVLPRHFRCSILLTLWAIFESAIIEIAEEVSNQQGKAIKLKDIRGDFLERTHKYFNHIIYVPLNTGDNRWQHLRIFHKLRNVIVHANGRFENINNDATKNIIKKWAKEKIGIQEMNGVIMISSDFIKNTFEIVLEILLNLTEIVKSEYPLQINRQR